MSAYVPAAKRRHSMTCGNSRGPVGSIKETVDGFVRRIDFEPGYDCLEYHGQNKHCHGRHGMSLRFMLMGEEGVTQFLMYATDWLPGSVDALGSTRSERSLHGVMGADLGHHWLRPTYSGEWSRGSCEYLHGARCFYDGSGLGAGPVLARFFDDGVDAVWEELALYYRSCAEGAAA